MTLFIRGVLGADRKKVLKMSLVKVSVEAIDNNNEKKLHEIDMSKSLEENINSICELFDRPPGNIYGLKVLSTNDGKCLHTYISEDNFKDIKDGYFLKLVYSLSHYVKRIFEHIDDEYKERSFLDLYDLSVDPEFIKEIVKTDKHLKLIDLVTNAHLTENEATPCLIAIVHLFQKGCLNANDISLQFLKKVFSLYRSDGKDEVIKYALSVIHKVLCHREVTFYKWKEETIKEVSITDFITLIKKKDDRPDLQYGAMLVINALIKCCKGDKRQQLVKEINQKQNREAIYEHIISTNPLDKNMARELYIYQTYLLSSFAEPLNSTITLNDNDLFDRDEFEITDSEVKKLTLLMDFDETATRNKSSSIDNLLDLDDVRISLASMSSRLSEDSRLSNRLNSVRTISESFDYENLKISVLTVEALRHYKKYHYKNFWQSQIEEKFYEPGILVSSERIIRMLAKILNIGVEPDRSSTCYQPTIFNCSSRIPFFFELFSRTMWLLSKTRREMKASTFLDYEKVLYVLAKQIKLVLEEKPMDFKILTAKMVETNYEKVIEKWEKEKQQELKNILDTHPSVQVLKEQFAKENQKLVFEQRMNYIRNGTMFPKFVEKKINGNFKAKLSTSGRDIIVSDFNAVTKTLGNVQIYPITNITHIVEGKACPHVKNNSVKEPHLAFSIIINHSDYINFKAADRKMASYWLDALYLLLEKENRSEYYKKELDELVEMDLVLHLMDLQNVTLPKKPPPIPKIPFETRPTIPPKPKSYPNKVTN